MKPLLAALALLVVGCGEHSLDLSQPIHLIPDARFSAACPSEEFCRNEMLSGLDQWLGLLPEAQRPSVVWGQRGPTNNIRLTVRDFDGAAAGKFGWHGGDGVVTFDNDGMSAMIASHEFGHALLHGDDSDHVLCDTDVRDVMADSLLCWEPVTVADLARVCESHPELDCAGVPGLDS